MKALFSLLVIYSGFSLFDCCLFSQAACPEGYRNYEFNANNIRAVFSPKGVKFFEGSQSGFQVPYPSPNDVGAIFISTAWLGGFDDANGFKRAMEVHPGYQPSEFSAGPLSSTGLPYEDLCDDFSKIWNVYAEDIALHRSDFLADGIIDDTIESIFSWPGRGNEYFGLFNGFELPLDHDSEWAPFEDVNGNNMYDPENGDFPVVFFKGNHYIPDQFMWMVYNDIGFRESENEPLGVEIQLSIFAFNCQDNEWLRNALFSSYKIINRSAISLDSVLFGFWTDYDLGCTENDLPGCDTLTNSEFIYNRDSVEHDCILGVPAYQNVSPVLSTTYLDQELHAFSGFNFQLIEYTNNGYYNLLSGRWYDNLPITPFGDGINPGSPLTPTRYLWPGDPRDADSWAGINYHGINQNDFVISSVKLGRFDPGDIRTVTTAHMFHLDTMKTYLDQFTLMYNNVDSLLASLSGLNNNCTPFRKCLDGNCVWPGDEDHNGIVEAYDLLRWAYMKESEGDERDGLVSWKGHYCDEWSLSAPDGINFKHGDADGNGIIDTADLDRWEKHYLFTRPDYIPNDFYFEGDDLILSASYIDSHSIVKGFQVGAGKIIKDILGITFEIEFDTMNWKVNSFFSYWPGSDTNYLLLNSGKLAAVEPTFLKDYTYAGIQTNNQPFDLQEDDRFINHALGFASISGLSYDELPDCMEVRLKNAFAIDASGNKIPLGSNTLSICKQNVTSIEENGDDMISVFPNPASDLIYLDSEEARELEIITLSGQAVKKGFASQNTHLDLRDLLPGFYFVKVSDSQEIFKLSIMR